MKIRLYKLFLTKTNMIRMFPKVVTAKSDVMLQWRM